MNVGMHIYLYIYISNNFLNISYNIYILYVYEFEYICRVSLRFFAKHVVKLESDPGLGQSA